MESGRALTFLNEMLWNSLIVAAPVLLATLFIGLIT
jgi:flagellar biosynthesis protein FliQ